MFISVVWRIWSLSLNFYMATVDVVYLVSHVLHHADSGLSGESRKLLHEQTILHEVKVVDS